MLKKQAEQSSASATSSSVPAMGLPYLQRPMMGGPGDSDQNHQAGQPAAHPVGGSGAYHLGGGGDSGYGGGGGGNGDGGEHMRRGQPISKHGMHVNNHPSQGHIGSEQSVGAPVYYQNAYLNGLPSSMSNSASMYGYSHQPGSAAPPPSTMSRYSSGPGMQGPGGFSSSSGGMSGVPASPPSSSALYDHGMVKTQSHAVLMELFARDEELVARDQEQAANSSKYPQEFNVGGGGEQVAGAGHHYHHHQQQQQQSGVTSGLDLTALNAPTIPCVKSINSINRMEGLGRGDSYAFLEVFFNASVNAPVPMVAKKEEDNVGLSLEEEDAEGRNGSTPLQPSSLASSLPLQPAVVSRTAELPVPPPKVAPGLTSSLSTGSSGANAAPLAAAATATAAAAAAAGAASPNLPERPPEDEPKSLKRAYDDALAAKGLISVSKSSENLMSLPGLMQKSISQEFKLKHSRGRNGEAVDGEGSVCKICKQPGADTILRPCGHMFHGSCLKQHTAFSSAVPVCPIDNIPMESAVLAIADGGGASGGGKRAKSDNKWEDEGVYAPPSF